MKKVGIVSCYFKYNYGSMLQAYATKYILDKNQIENETISCDENASFKKGKKKFYRSQIFNFSFIKSKLGMVMLKFRKKLNKKLGNNIKTRNKYFNEFKKEHFNLSVPYKTYDELSKSSYNYSSFIVGSDQLWLPVNVVADYYTLNWVPDDVNKVSYSTSFGVSKVEKKYEGIYKKFLNRINHLSVREESGVKLIKDLTKLDAKLVCDPTLLLTRDDWDKIVDSKRIIDDKYILCYFLGKNKNHRKFAEKLKKLTGFKIVSLNHLDEYVKYSDKFCDEAPYNIGPSEFINLIKNAEYICTDSFHGTVFSVIYNKYFFDFRRHKANSKISTNSRIDTLLNIAGIESKRILTGLENPNDYINLEIDWDTVDQNIDSFRKESEEWLLASLRGDMNE